LDPKEDFLCILRALYCGENVMKRHVVYCWGNDGKMH